MFRSTSSGFIRRTSGRTWLPLCVSATTSKSGVSSRARLIPSLISLWSTAPLLLNNSVGAFEAQPSVQARMRSFDNAIEKLLWPEKRERDSLLGNKIPGMIDRTTSQSFIRIYSGYLPDILQSLRGFGERYLPWLVGDHGIEIGPIPQGTPVGLLTNINPLSEDSDTGKRVAHAAQLVDMLVNAISDLKKLPKGASDEEARAVFKNLVDPMLSLSKCPDLVVNRGHYFGTGYNGEPALSDDDKRALIEFLKTF